MTPPVKLLVSNKPQVGFVNKRGSVERVARGFRGHPRGGECPQLVVDEREQLGGGVAVTDLSGFEEASHIGHCAECNRGVTAGNSKATVYPSVESPDWYFLLA